MNKTSFYGIVGLLVSASLIVSAYPVFNGASLLGSLGIFGITFFAYAHWQIRRAPGTTDDHSQNF